jgi:hypothetical protein
MAEHHLHVYSEITLEFIQFYKFEMIRTSKYDSM